VAQRRAEGHISYRIVDQPVKAIDARLGQRVLGYLLDRRRIRAIRIGRSGDRGQQQCILRAAPHHDIAQKAGVRAQIVIRQTQRDSPLIDAARYREGIRRD